MKKKIMRAKKFSDEFFHSNEELKYFSDFITLDPKGSKLYHKCGINKTNYQKILNYIPIPITLWELKGEDFLLVYSNKAAEEIIEPELSLGIKLSKALPGEYKNIFVHISSKDENNSSAQIMIDKNLLLIFHNGLKGNPIDQNPNQNQENYKKEPFKTILEQSPVSIIITDIQGNIEYINPKFVEITGYSPNEVIGKNPRIWKTSNKSSEEYKRLWDTILSGNVWKGEFINRRKNGEFYYESAVISPIKDLNGVINNFIAIKEDITKLKEIDNELRKSEKFAAIGKMTAYLSHEIKSPLSVIKMNLDLMISRTVHTGPCNISLSLISKELSHIDHLLQDVLNYSRHSSLKFVSISMSEKIDSIKQGINHLLTEKQIEIKNHIAEQKVFADAQKIQSLFAQLINNSIEAIGNNGVIEFTSRVNRECELLDIFLKDNGCGFNDPIKVFVPFYTTKSSGTGLGLAIAKKIVEQHNGSIKLVSSKPGETIFKISLPLTNTSNGQNINN